MNRARMLPRVVAGLAGLAAASMVLTGCAAGSSDAAASVAPVPAVTYAAGEPLTAAAAGTCKPNGKKDAEQQIAYVPPSSVFSFYLAVGAGIQARAKGAGSNYFMIAPPKDDVSVQLGMIQDATTRGADAIILNTHDQTAAAPVIKAATDKGIAVVLVNSDIPDFPTPVQGVVGYKQRASEKALGEYVVAHNQGATVKYGIIAGAPDYFSDERVAGWRSGVSGAANFSEVATVSGKWTVDGGNSAALDMIQAHPEITMLFAANDNMAQGALQALKSVGRTDVKIYGTDGDVNSGLEPIAAGELTGTLNTAPFQMGEIAAQVALDCLAGRIPGGQFINSPTSIVDKSNVLALLCKPESLYPQPNKQYSCS